MPAYHPDLDMDSRKPGRRARTKRDTLFVADIVDTRPGQGRARHRRTPHGPVFVDNSGRRRRMIRLLAIVGSGVFSCSGIFLAATMLNQRPPSALLPLPPSPVTTSPNLPAPKPVDRASPRPPRPIAPLPATPAPRVAPRTVPVATTSPAPSPVPRPTTATPPPPTSIELTTTTRLPPGQGGTRPTGPGTNR